MVVIPLREVYLCWDLEQILWSIMSSILDGLIFIYILIEKLNDGENLELEVRRQVWVLRYKLEITLIENCSLNSKGELGLLGPERIGKIDPLELHGRRMAGAERTETELSER